jgi:hypothetical protein
MKFVATKTVDQLDLQAQHRIRERLVRQRTGIINQIRVFLLERGIAIASMRSLPRIRGHGRLGHLINSRLDSNGSAPLPAEKSNTAIGGSSCIVVIYYGPAY